MVISGRGVVVELSGENEISLRIGEAILDVFDREGGCAINLSLFSFGDGGFYKWCSFFEG